MAPSRSQSEGSLHGCDSLVYVCSCSVPTRSFHGTLLLSPQVVSAAALGRCCGLDILSRWRGPLSAPPSSVATGAPQAGECGRAAEFQFHLIFDESQCSCRTGWLGGDSAAPGFCWCSVCPEASLPGQLPLAHQISIPCFCREAFPDLSVGIRKSRAFLSRGPCALPVPCVRTKRESVLSDFTVISPLQGPVHV